MIDKHKVYNIQDIQIVDVRRGEKVVRNERECYDSTVVIDGNVYIAKWYPSDEKYLSAHATAHGADNLLAIYVDGCKNSVTISDGVIKTIKDRIDF